MDGLDVGRSSKSETELNSSHYYVCKVVKVIKLKIGICKTGSLAEERAVCCGVEN